MKYYFLLFSISFTISLLIFTRNVNAYEAPVIRAENVSQTITTRQPSSGSKYLCHDEIQIIDKELAHGEQINAYPRTICK